jgi:hypothetical protein
MRIMQNKLRFYLTFPIMYGIIKIMKREIRVELAKERL